MTELELTTSPNDHASSTDTACEAPRGAPALPPHPCFELGSARSIVNPAQAGPLQIPAHHFVTHGVVVGMTGSGKTGLVTVIAEEALRSSVPILVLDVKGDLPNLLLALPSFDAAEFLPYVEAARGPDDTRDANVLAAELASSRRAGLLDAGITEAALRAYHDSVDVRVLTPGGGAGEPLHLLSSLELASARWKDDPEGALVSLESAVSLVLRLVGRERDPAKSREHALLVVLARRRLASGGTADLATLIADLEEPPIERIGAMDVDDYVPPHDRRVLATALNTLLATPSLASWRQGAALDVGEWLAPKNGRTQAVVLSVAHLDDAERALVLGVVLDEVLTWVRAQAGSPRLRAMVLFDEVYGFLPPHPANPPTKRPLVALMKQARAFGVGVVLATQNPMDLDYRALGNAGVWCVGRLQTDADRARVVDGMTGGDAGAGAGAKSQRKRARGKESEASRLGALVKQLPPRLFIVRDAHDAGMLLVLRPRQTISWMRGPMTRDEVRRATLNPPLVGRLRAQ